MLEVLVIGEYLDLVSGTKEVGAPLFKCGDDGKQLLVVDFVIDFGRAEFL